MIAINETEKKSNYLEITQIKSCFLVETSKYFCSFKLKPPPQLKSTQRSNVVEITWYLVPL